MLDTGGARPDTIVQAKVLDNLTLGITLNPATAIRFNSRGNALGFSSTIKLCDDRDDDSKGRGMAVSNLGSVQALVDSDAPKDGIVNDHLNGGGNVACP